MCRYLPSVVRERVKPACAKTVPRMESIQAKSATASTTRRPARTVRGRRASERRWARSPGSRSSAVWERPATTEAATPICPLVNPATRRSRFESLRSTVEDGSLPTPSGARRARVNSSRRSRAAGRERAGSDISGCPPPPAASTRSSTTPKRRWITPCTVFTLWTCSSGSERSFFESTPRLKCSAPPATRYVVARQESTPHTAPRMATATMPSKMRITVLRPNSPLMSAAMPGNAARPSQRRIVPRAASSIPARWRRCSSANAAPLEFIGLARQLGDAVAHLGGGFVGELGDLVGASRRVEDDRREPEAALQGSPPRVHVLDPGHRHQGACDPDEPPLQVHLQRTDLVPPPPPQQRRQHEHEQHRQRQRPHDRQRRQVNRRLRPRVEHVGSESAAGEDRGRL